MGELQRTGDPRLIDNGKFYETPPMSGPTTDTGATKSGKKAKSKQ
jgi:hypothetical protein